MICWLQEFLTSPLGIAEGFVFYVVVILPVVFLASYKMLIDKEKILEYKDDTRPTHIKIFECAALNSIKLFACIVIFILVVEYFAESCL